MKITILTGHSVTCYVRSIASPTQLAHSKVLQLATVACSAHRLAPLTGLLRSQARSTHRLAPLMGSLHSPANSTRRLTPLTGSLRSQARSAHRLAPLTGLLRSRARSIHGLAPFTGSLHSQADLYMVRAGVDGGWMPLPTRPQRYCNSALLVFKDLHPVFCQHFLSLCLCLLSVFPSVRLCL